ncbi:MAG TPA: ABC transporter ATP-binding protein [Candidatus Woesebacteria bacterium]|nr:ABC transporter ATP-binding protein [Candidatus Woesebacteria bacterium]
MKRFKEFLLFFGQYKWRMVIFLSVTVTAVVLETVRPYWLKMILDSVENGNEEIVLKFFILFGISMVISNWINALSYFIGDGVIIPMSRRIRETIFQKVLELDFAYHTEKSTGSLISAFRRGDNAVFSIFDSVFYELFRVLISLIITTVFLYQASAEMAWLLLGVFFINLGLIWWLIKINLKARTEFNASDDVVAGVIADGMINYETVKFFAAEKKERSRLSEKFNDWIKKLWIFSNSFRVMDIAISSSAGSGVMLIIWLAIKKVGTNFGATDLVMIVGFITAFYWKFFNLFFRIRDIAKNMTDLEKYFEILTNETLVKDPKKEVLPKKDLGKIEFENVGFVYPKNKQKIIDRISLVVKPGEKVAFVGRSGAGKTTLVKLLLRFYDVSEGRIKIDGVDIKKMKKASLRSRLGVVPQEPIMFNNTIKFNLTYGKDSASMEEIREAAKKANILEFIEKLTDGWETQVGERGIKLSGGQKQRLAIARALLTDPRILIFDEATSNLDSESEKMIQKALDEIGSKRTLVMVAHRFSTIRDADKIVVLSNGSISEIGKHEELIKKNGLYKKLWTLQSKGKLVESAGEVVR